jgi:hypothetical protein
VEQFISGIWFRVSRLSAGKDFLGYMEVCASQKSTGCTIELILFATYNTV